MQTLDFRLPLPPTANNAYRNLPRGRALSRAAREWKASAAPVIAAAVRRHRWQLAHKGTPVCCSIALDVAFDRDVDGSSKLILDEMSGLVYHDDRQVIHLSLTKYRVPRASTGVSVSVWRPVDGR